MSPGQFENIVGELYQKMGYEVRVTGGSGDQGIDVLAERQDPGGRERLAIQCKHQKATVGGSVLRDLWGVINSDQSLTLGVVVTSSSFSSDARQFATGKRLRLIDRPELERLLQEYQVARF